MYHNELKNIAITYFLATLAILDTKIAITPNSASFGVFEVYSRQITKISFYNYFRYFLF